MTDLSGFRLLPARNADSISATATSQINPVIGARIKDEAIRAVIAHGQDPCKRNQAADHESGHCLVYKATGQQIASTELKQRKQYGRSVWLGVTYLKVADRKKILDLTSESGRSLVSIGIGYLSGVAGERAGGSYHPASSTDELVLAAATFEVLGRRIGVSGEVLQRKAENLVDDFLVRNSRHRRELAALLRDRKRVDGRVIDAILKDLPIFDFAEALFQDA